MNTTYITQYKPEGDGNWYTILNRKGGEVEYPTYAAAKECMEGYLKHKDSFMYKGVLGMNFEWRIMEKHATITYEHPRV